MSDPKKYLPPRRVMPGAPLPTLNQRHLDERSFHLSKIGSDAFSGELVNCEGGTIIGPLTLSADFAHNTGKFGVFGATPAAQIGGSTDVLAGMVTLGFRAASSNPPLNLGAGALTAGAVTLSGDFSHTGVHFGVFGAAPVVQQANASQAAITAVTDVNAKAALQSLYNALKNLGACAATA